MFSLPSLLNYTVFIMFYTYLVKTLPYVKFLNENVIFIVPHSSCQHNVCIYLVSQYLPCVVTIVPHHYRTSPY